MNNLTGAKQVVDLMSVLLKNLEERRVRAANRPREEKQQLGQFLTPFEVAALVASLFRPLSSSTPIRLLDPGAGIGSLTVAFVNWLVQQECRPESVEIVALELDEDLLPLLTETLSSCEALATNIGLPLNAQVVSCRLPQAV